MISLIICIISISLKWDYYITSLVLMEMGLVYISQNSGSVKFYGKLLMLGTLHLTVTMLMMNNLNMGALVMLKMTLSYLNTSGQSISEIQEMGYYMLHSINLINSKLLVTQVNLNTQGKFSYNISWSFKYTPQVFMMSMLGSKLDMSMVLIQDFLFNLTINSSLGFSMDLLDKAYSLSLDFMSFMVYSKSFELPTFIWLIPSNLTLLKVLYQYTCETPLCMKLGVGLISYLPKFLTLQPKSLKSDFSFKLLLLTLLMYLILIMTV